MKNIKNFKILYSGVVLDEKNRSKLLSHFSVSNGWKSFAHHMTIAFGKSLESLNLQNDKDKIVDLEVTHIGETDKVIAVKVSGYYSTNETPHITLYVNVDDGGKPVMSNKITNWKKLQEPFIVSGKVTDVIA
jgi:hypothetical protein